MRSGDWQLTRIFYSSGSPAGWVDGEAFYSQPGFRALHSNGQRIESLGKVGIETNRSGFHYVLTIDSSINYM